ncbi:hypothetical protein [Priestia megaterium]|nr:hypothetical protein [Priestia megaterium]
MNPYQKETKCPKCGEKYNLCTSAIDYQFCCDECNIILYPYEDYGREA